MRAKKPITKAPVTQPKATTPPVETPPPAANPIDGLRYLAELATCYIKSLPLAAAGPVQREAQAAIHLVESGLAKPPK